MDISARWRRLLLGPVAMVALVLLMTSCGDSDEGGAGGSGEGASIEDAAAGGSAASEDDDTATGGDTGTGDGSDAADEPDAAVPTDDATDDATAGESGEELFPDVLAATAERGPDGSWTFSATLSSPYDTPERYADAWRVLGPDGEVYGIRELAHDHAGEQPFTRSQSGIIIPDDVTRVTVQGRDQVSGWGGASIEVELER